jgi:Fe-S oxidoreductase
MIVSNSKRIRALAEKHFTSDAAATVKELNGVCPVAKVNKAFTPEAIVRTAMENPAALPAAPCIWECLACGLCETVSNGAVGMSMFIRDVRAIAFSQGIAGHPTHGGACLTAQRIAARGGPAGRGLAWLDGSCTVAPDKGETLFWAGTAPLLAALMPQIAGGCLDSIRAGVRMLNRLGVTPAVLSAFHPSGHDLLWTGDVDSFRRLAEKNLRDIAASGAKRIIVSSPEDCYTLAKSYPEYCGGCDAKICHITGFIACNLARLHFDVCEKTATLHDPCRLGRFMGEYDAPRDILRAVPGLKLVEMPRSREMAPCCGTSCWTHCSRYSKQIQVLRLAEACTAGAGVLLTPCAECAVHFRCTMRPGAWQETDLPVQDLLTFIEPLARERS